MNYSIGTVAAMTGLTPHAIRAWERRHHVLSPTRTGTNHRTYDDADIERLKLLRDAVSQGHGIGRAAQMSNEELRSFLNSRDSKPVLSGDLGHPEQLLASCVAAVERLDETGLWDSFLLGVGRFGISTFIESIVLPLIAITEQRCNDKSFSIAQEHLVSAVLRTKLEHLRISIPESSHARRILVTTLKGQIHELGALVISVIAGVEGWNVTYLGTNLPAEEIVEAVKQCRANALALSLVYPTDDRNIGRELKEIRKGLGAGFPVIVGGRAANGYLAPLGSLGIIECSSTLDFKGILSDISG